MDQELTDGDYVLSEGRAWFTVGGRSVRIVDDGEGYLHVFVYELNNEMHDPIADITVATAEDKEQ